MEKRPFNNEEGCTENVFSKMVSKNMELLIKEYEFSEIPELETKRKLIIKDILEFLNIDERESIAQDIIGNKLSTVDIIQIWVEEGIAGLRRYLVDPKGEIELTVRKTEEEKYKEIREQREKPEDSEPELKEGKTGGTAEEEEDIELMLTLLKDRGLIEDTPEATEFWRNFLKEIEDKEFLLETYVTI